jgi:hypothetical protein
LFALGADAAFHFPLGPLRLTSVSFLPQGDLPENDRGRQQGDHAKGRSHGQQGGCLERRKQVEDSAL